MTRLSRLSIYSLLLLALFALAACSPEGPAVQGVSTDFEVTYRREGGFAGISQEWMIFPDGRIVAPDGQEMLAPAEDVIALLAKLKALELLALSENYSDDDACCDLFIYTVTFRIGDETTVLQTSDGADHPEEVSLLLADIEGLIAKAEPVK